MVAARIALVVGPATALCATAGGRIRRSSHTAGRSAQRVDSRPLCAGARSATICASPDSSIPASSFGELADGSRSRPIHAPAPGLRTTMTGRRAARSAARDDRDAPRGLTAFGSSRFAVSRRQAGSGGALREDAHGAAAGRRAMAAAAGTSLPAVTSAAVAPIAISVAPRRSRGGDVIDHHAGALMFVGVTGVELQLPDGRVQARA
jgi:hypothetical protein